MAEPDDLDPNAPPAPKKGGLMSVLIPIVVLTLLAAGGGWLIGMQIVASVKAATGSDPKPPAAAAAAAPVGPESVVKELIPIVTNLAPPDNANWVRLQTAIVYDKSEGPQIDLLSAQIADDMLAFVRTLNLTQLQGATGLQHLREDLNERASIRSDGHVRDLMIETLVIQ